MKSGRAKVFERGTVKFLKKVFGSSVAVGAFPRSASLTSSVAKACLHVRIKWTEKKPSLVEMHIEVGVGRVPGTKQGVHWPLASSLAGPSSPSPAQGVVPSASRKAPGATRSVMERMVAWMRATFAMYVGSRAKVAVTFCVAEPGRRGTRAREGGYGGKDAGRVHEIRKMGKQRLG